MASLFGPFSNTLRLLDPGAGALTASVVKRLCHRHEGVSTIKATLYEIDPQILDALFMNMPMCRRLTESLS